MTIDWKAVQSRLGVASDGIAGPITYGALLAKVGGRKPIDGLGAALALHASDYAIDANPDRMAGFLGECAHESLGFTLTRELWGPTPAQRGYEGRADLGNMQAGDGFLYRGRGLIQITGCANYTDAARDLGLDLVNHPELAEKPDGAVLVALWFWRRRNINALCDARDWTGLTRRVNGGTNGLAERLAYINRALGVLA